MGKTPVTNTYWKLAFCSSDTEVSGIERVKEKQKSLLLSLIMFSFELNCTAWKRGILG